MDPLKGGRIVLGPELIVLPLGEGLENSIGNGNQIEPVSVTGYFSIQSTKMENGMGKIFTLHSMAIQCQPLYLLDLSLKRDRQTDNIIIP